MKRVIFVCLLSLSVSFSLPSPQQEATPVAPTGAPVAAGAVKASPVETVQAPTAVVQTPAVNETKVNTPTETSPNVTATVNGPQTVPAVLETSTPKKESKPTEKDNKTDTKPDKDESKPVDDKTVAPHNKTEAVTVSPTTATTKGTNADNKKNETTTPKGEIVNPTVAPTEAAQSRAFDGPSFIGGIILTLGILAIGFMGFKYYKNQTERNYHTL